MNVLAHALVAVKREESIAGHLLGDFFRGPPEEIFTPELAQGVRVHRAVDAFTEDHPVFHRSRVRLDAPYRRFAGILVDVYYDHFLVTHWEKFGDESLSKFVDRVHDDLRGHHTILPERMQGFVDFMISQDLLVSYGRLEGIDRTFRGISRRLARENPVHGALEVLEEQRAGFERDFLEFLPALLHQFR